MKQTYEYTISDSDGIILTIGRVTVLGGIIAAAKFADRVACDDWTDAQVTEVVLLAYVD